MENLVNGPLLNPDPNSITLQGSKRENCFRRVREDRTRLLWNLRLSDCQHLSQKEIINSAFQDIVSDELKKIEDTSRNLCGNPSVTCDCDDILWEYEEGLAGVYEGDSEEILLEMQKIFYKDLLSETTVNGSCVQTETWEEEEDKYLATLVSQNMCINSEQEQNQIFCPICRQGELMENHRYIYCNMCEMQLNKGEEVNLNILKGRLAEAHAEHPERGCRVNSNISREDAD